MTTMWGIHNDALGAELIEQGFVSIGWEEIQDLRTIQGDRASLKDLVRRTYPHIKPGAVPVWAGILSLRSVRICGMTSRPDTNSLMGPRGWRR